VDSRVKPGHDGALDRFLNQLNSTRINSHRYKSQYLALGSNTGATLHGGSSPDQIQGVALRDGVQWPVRATTSYAASPIDQTMVEQSNHYRVAQVCEALAFWIARDLGS
jgi:hypothetical protein